MELVTHSVTLRGEQVTLRPLTEADWPVLMHWNTDPDVLYFSEGDDVQSYSLEEVQRIYRTVSQNALCFMIEYQGQPVGDCWLQRMNVERVLEEYAGFDVRRIDLIIGHKRLWNQGVGTEVVRLLTEFAFQQEGVDYLYEPGIADYNRRSQRIFEKNDYRLVARIPQPPGGKARELIEYVAKNPRLGLHSYAVHLFFDPETEDTIRTIWRELADSGTAPYFYQSANRPHLTLSIYRSLDLPVARQRLAEFASRQVVQPISFQFHGIFPGPKPITFICAPVTAELLHLQAAVCDLLDNLGELPETDYYRPGRWMPYCALAMEFDTTLLDDALRIALHRHLPINGEIREMGLIEMRPIRHLDCWSLRKE